MVGGEVKTVREAIDYLKTIGTVVERVKYKYMVYFDSDSFGIETDRDLIEYVNEQKEAVED